MLDVPNFSHAKDAAAILSQLRVCVAAPRSGSTLFMRIMANSTEVAVTSRNTLMGRMLPRPHDLQMRPFEPDYSIYCDPNHSIYRQAHRLGKSVVISKEELGNDRKTGTPAMNECNYNIFPTIGCLLATKPVFLFRDPCRMFDSWLNCGWDDIESFRIACDTLFDTFDTAWRATERTLFYTHEFFTHSRRNQIAVLSEICKSWGIHFHEEMLSFGDDFGNAFVFQSDREKNLYTTGRPDKIFATISRSDGVLANVPAHDLITEQHRRYIESSGLSQRYSDIHRLCESTFAQ